MRLYAEGLAEPVLIDGDPVRVEQIAWNLLSNAIKFTRSGGSVTVRLSHDDDEALLEVIDTGRGISPAFLPQVFQMFRQADAATTRDEGGLGIGLALVKSLVELHGGRVAAESAGRGRGTTMRVWLPMHQPTGFGELDMAEETEPGRTIAGSRVLLVDDTPDMLETFGYLLEHEGARVTPAKQRRGGAGAGRDRGLRPGDLRRRHAGHGRLPVDRRDEEATAHRRPAGDRPDRARTDGRTSSAPWRRGSMRTSASRSTSRACARPWLRCSGGASIAGKGSGTLLGAGADDEEEGQPPIA